ncbi:NAD(P)-binding domain-containing protein [Tumebacillus sp. ITR2]|uniref:NAD(P)-binding domain-containing protein n=1 Tax=Tumebacillus amylolyticus TaxID=2801339 RepID=A0ABS1JEA9_9BACL|nr:3-hydroxyacyl-CoA dehydrogenase NAD-binding domain-containing protein [Tumebacillus amylolyticus]MBL0388589.1 NAD(P)-binding domain-containing protein [Tumebacillus amylolyticus]
MKIQKIGIVGAGTMGQGLAAAMAGKGVEVILLDRTEQDLEHAKLGLELSLDHRLAKWGITEAEKKSILSRIVLGTNVSLLRDCEVVIESIWENLEDKIELLLAIEKEVGPEALLATNTSTLSITELAAQTAHPERVIGLHFHFPVDRRELVEVVRGLKTSERTVESAYRFLEALDKKAVQVFESPGFITTRLMLPLINEAVLIYAEGVATAEDIDKAMKHGFGFHIGPLELADRFGLDTVVDMLEAMFHETTDPRYRPAAYLRKLVRGGLLGTKVRKGFFQYDEWGERA